LRDKGKTNKESDAEQKRAKPECQPFPLLVGAIVWPLGSRTRCFFLSQRDAENESRLVLEIKGRNAHLSSPFTVVAPHQKKHHSNENAPVPQHLDQQALVQLEQHARIGPPRDHELATLGVGREERHFVSLFPASGRARNSSRRFLKEFFFSKSFFFFSLFFFSTLSLSRSLALFLES
jgi:hypothetical protein